MQQRFELILQNEKTRSYRLIRLFLLLANAVGMTWILLNSSSWKEKGWPILSLTAIGIYFLFTTVDVLKKQFSYDTFPRLAYLWCAIAWTRTPLWWLAVAIIAFFVLDILAHRKLIIRVSKDGIRYPSLFEKKVEWSELNNFLLKDGLLTMDFRNNRLFQHLVANAEADINEKDFNEFCKVQLKAASGAVSALQPK